jgi:hypothetical protein
MRSGVVILVSSLEDANTICSRGLSENIEILLKVALNTIKPTNIFGRSSGQFDKVSFFGMPTKY